MMHHDLTKLAELVRNAHLQGQSIRLPAMRVRDIAKLTRLLRQLESAVPHLVH